MNIMGNKDPVLIFNVSDILFPPSFVICNLQPKVEAVFEKEELIDVMNITPTESEAWDIVQMEEIERELMGDFEEPSPLDPPKGED